VPGRYWGNDGIQVPREHRSEQARDVFAWGIIIFGVRPIELSAGAHILFPVPTPRRYTTSRRHLCDGPDAARGTRGSSRAAGNYRNVTNYSNLVNGGTNTLIGGNGSQSGFPLARKLLYTRRTGSCQRLEQQMGRRRESRRADLCLPRATRDVEHDYENQGTYRGVNDTQDYIPSSRRRASITEQRLRRPIKGPWDPTIYGAGYSSLQHVRRPC